MKNALFAAGLAVLSCAGCTTPPRFDVPYDKTGQPTAASIIQRVQCEIRDLVRDDLPGDTNGQYRKFLLSENYDVQVSLSLDVTESGGLAPSLTYMTPLTAATSFMFGAGVNLSKSRELNFSENLQLSVRKIYADWKFRPPSGDKIDVLRHDCPDPDTNLAGDLGIQGFVSMAALTPGLDIGAVAAGKGGFTGFVQFIITQNLTATGPTWKLTRVSGPGPLATLGHLNTDKVTVAFAQGQTIGNPITATTKANPFNPAAYNMLQQALVGAINARLSALQSGVP